ncbi:MAG: diphosphomevalonate decarboxylase [Bdellovibrio sp.]|nr:MAG: diphosphomevalonate decarboxylase [Bdellovibrio sp.]
MSRSWFQTAPSNIALIKYMGKTEGNVPTNPSLSYTLESYLSGVCIQEVQDAEKDCWVPLKKEGWLPVSLTPFAQDRYLSHWQFLKSYWDIEGHYRIASANNFSMSCGLASSASSFAALTKCAYEVAKVRGRNFKPLSSEELAALSRKGSGSSCRSFFSPWAYWDKEHVEAYSCSFNQLLHQVVLLDSRVKEVSSSEAHQRVRSSLLFSNRVERAHQRCQELKESLEKGLWKEAFQLCWEEMWDMHTLFETARPSFGYMNGKAVDFLHFVRRFWKKRGDGPLVTMDAGPNVHLLFREDQKGIKNEFSNHSLW